VKVSHEATRKYRWFPIDSTLTPALYLALFPRY